MYATKESRTRIIPLVLYSMSKFQIVAKTLQNLEPILAKELEALGASKIKILKRAVSFEGSDETLYTVNLCSRVAICFLVPIHSCETKDEHELYKEIYDLPWEDIINPDKTISVDASISGPNFNHSQYVALKTKDAIVDRLRKKIGYRPDVDIRNPDFKINIHIRNAECTVSMDSTGQTLDKRGYRLDAGNAPLNEVLAAGMLLMSGWQGEKDLYDPMCGSGTFAIEAAMIASKTPPGLKRNFCFQNWFDYDYKLYIKIRDKLESQIIKPQCQIHASDLDKNMLSYVHQNAQRIGVHEYIIVNQSNFLDSKAKSESGIILLNPPYDQRLAVANVEAFYKNIGDTFKQAYPNHEAWIISSNKEALKKLGLKASFKTELNNGGTMCKVHQYEMYSGSRLSKHSNEIVE